jgi:hypothetical protein
MPLAFQSLSHGEIAFGFFNIETDMILLDRYFFFAADFCAHVMALAGSGTGPIDSSLTAYILKQGDIGNLGGAIHGVEFTGFIGDVYRVFPFPKEPPAFKQNPEGYRTRAIIEEMVAKYAAPSRISVEGEVSGASIAIGEYVFSRRGFHELLRYVWMGGYPRWKGGVRPQYVLEMKTAAEAATHPLFGLKIEE